MHVVDLKAWPVWERPSGAVKRVTGALLPAAFLVWLAEPVLGHPTAVVVTAVVVYAGAYVTAFVAGIHAGPRARWLLVACLYGTGPVIALTAGDLSQLAQLAYAVLVGIVLLPLRWGVPLGLVTTASTALITWPGHSVPVTLGLVTLTTGMLFLLVRTVIMLREANARIAALSAAEERNRVARDLHDVLGHGLTAITAKLGLARRLFEVGDDPARGLAEVRDAERLSRQALGEIRATLSGYRRVSLAAELAGARAALQAAGISAVLPQAVEKVPEGLREPFAYVLREGVTNVIRHSRATRCEVRLGPSWLEVRDDGRAEPAPPGNGLTGLRERLAEVGARLEAGPLPGGGFRLMAALP
ncbi:sensor histidine kinase [Nonomuraea sp. CA-141351]|uniref:sensor histidine kinase n=1 Tax=Nonomuraea sp. CA-141351 TaxID=3239996 RepID=UPI003D93B4BE